MTYDLRSAPTLDADGMSLPYMTFGTYRNREFNGFSVSMDVHDNLIAASTDDRQVQLFNGASGQEIPNGSHNGFCNSGRQAMCLRFADKSYVCQKPLLSLFLFPPRVSNLISFPTRAGAALN